MADFCNECTKIMFGENVKPDIDIEQIGKELKIGYMRDVLCECCGLRIVVKDTSGDVLVAGEHLIEDDLMKLVPYEEYIVKYEKKRIK